MRLCTKIMPNDFECHFLSSFFIHSFLLLTYLFIYLLVIWYLLLFLVYYKFLVVCVLYNGTTLIEISSVFLCFILSISVQVKVYKCTIYHNLFLYSSIYLPITHFFVYSFTPFFINLFINSFVYVHFHLHSWSVW